MCNKILIKEYNVLSRNIISYLKINMVSNLGSQQNLPYKKLINMKQLGCDPSPFIIILMVIADDS